MNEDKFRTLGDGYLAYIKTLTLEEAKRMFPSWKEEESIDVHLFSLHAADGTPLALTDTRQAAIGHALDDDLQIASVH